MEGNRSRGQGAVRSGLLTGISTVAVSASAAVLGIILSRKFGHGVKTDGFFAAYGVYLALVLVAGSLRVIVLPRFVAAREDDRLAHEVGAWSAGLALPLAVLTAIAIAWPHGIAGALAANHDTRGQAAALLPWVVVSAVAQIYGGLVASALAALDDYQWAAFGFAVGSIAGVALTLAFVGHGVIAFGWGLALNGALSLGIPLAALLARSSVARPDVRVWGRMLELGEGVSLPFALQGLYLIAYRFASGLGPGRATTFSYAYLIAAFLVSVTAASIALVATVPFARGGSSPERVAKHVVASSWLSLAPVAAAAGVFALAGATVARHVLGPSYGGGTGRSGPPGRVSLAVYGRLGRGNGDVSADLRARPGRLAPGARARGARGTGGDRLGASRRVPPRRGCGRARRDDRARLDGAARRTRGRPPGRRRRRSRGPRLRGSRHGRLRAAASRDRARSRRRGGARAVLRRSRALASGRAASCVGVPAHVAVASVPC